MKRLLAWLKAAALFVLEQPRLAADIGIVFLIALIWFAGPFVGLESVDTRVQLIFAIAVLRVLVHILQYVLAQKRATKLEASLKEEGQKGRSDKAEEIEAVINRHPDVRMSRAKSRKSPITGGIVVADVILTEGTDPARAKDIRDQILAQCRTQLASHKVPAVIRFVEALDVTPAGKLARTDS